MRDLTGPDRRVEAVAEGGEGRVDTWLARLTGRTRSSLTRLFAEGRVQLNGRPARPGERVAPGDRLTADLAPKPPSPTPAPPPPAVELAYVDPYLLVVNKPRGLVVHPAPAHPGDTLADWLTAWAAARGQTLPGRGGLVHRLDRDTTGLLLVARTEEVLSALTQALRRREIHRRYLVLVRGRPRAVRTAVEAPVGRDRQERQRMAVAAGGRPAVTHFTLLEALGPFSLLAADLETGRTHQIRVHLKAIGLPVVGDPVYGWGRGGQLLHAASLTFRHPVRGEVLHLEAPVPPDFQAVLDALRSGGELPEGWAPVPGRP